MIMPPCIQPGGCIGIFSPAGPARDEEQVQAGLEVLRSLGFRTRYAPPSSSAPPYLAAGDAARADEFLSMWADPEIHAMMAVRGGYGCMRMMGRINLKRLGNSPKPVIGFSDLTALLNALADQAGVVAFHGPVLATLAQSDPESIKSLVARLTGKAPISVFAGLEILRPGTASGIIRGGNLTTLSHMAGTPWDIPWQDAILVLEDTGEAMYRIDRMLTQLAARGCLDKLKGLILGAFDCGKNESANAQLQREVWDRALELTVDADFPVWGNFPAGHLRQNHTIPLGAAAIMDSAACSLVMEPPAA